MSKRPKKSERPNEEDGVEMEEQEDPAVRDEIDASPVKQYEPLEKLNKELMDAAEKLQPREVQFLVYSFYQMQKNRIRGGNQLHALEKTSESALWTRYIYKNAKRLEDNVYKGLDAYSNMSELGRWCRSLRGMGPVMTSGLLALIDLRIAVTAGQIYRRGGWDPQVIWVGQDECKKWVNDFVERNGKDFNVLIHAACKFFGRKYETILRDATTNFKTGEKRKLTTDGVAAALARRPWVALLHTLGWKISSSFVMFKNRPEKYDPNVQCFYGQFFDAVKADLIVRNEAGELEDAAKKKLLEIPKTHKQRKTYEKGILPASHINARAKRAVLKLFISHYHEVGRKLMGLPVPAPYPIAHQGHTDYIPPPNFG